MEAPPAAAAAAAQAAAPGRQSTGSHSTGLAEAKEDAAEEKEEREEQAPAAAAPAAAAAAAADHDDSGEVQEEERIVHCGCPLREGPGSCDDIVLGLHQLNRKRNRTAEWNKQAARLDALLAGSMELLQLAIDAVQAAAPQQEQDNTDSETRNTCAF